MWPGQWVEPDAQQNILPPNLPDSKGDGPDCELPKASGWPRLETRCWATENWPGSSQAILMFLSQVFSFFSLPVGRAPATAEIFHDKMYFAEHGQY